MFSLCDISETQAMEDHPKEAQKPATKDISAQTSHPPKELTPTVPNLDLRGLGVIRKMFRGILLRRKDKPTTQLSPGQGLEHRWSIAFSNLLNMEVPEGADCANICMMLMAREGVVGH